MISHKKQSENRVEIRDTLVELYNRLDPILQEPLWILQELPFITDKTLEKIIKWNGTRILEFKYTEKLNKEFKVVLFTLLKKKVWTVEYISAKR
jgi:hypothetical protein